MPTTKIAVPRELIAKQTRLASPTVAGESPAERGWGPSNSGPRS